MKLFQQCNQKPSYGGVDRARRNLRGEVTGLDDGLCREKRKNKTVREKCQRFSDFILKNELLWHLRFSKEYKVSVEKKF